MNALYAGSLGIAAALVSTLTHAEAVASDALVSETPARDATALEPARPSAALPSLSLLDPGPPPGGPQLNVRAAGKTADGKSQMMALTEDLPGASQILGVLLYPTERGMSITRDDGTPAVTFTVMPTKITHGKGIVAIAKF